MRYKIFLPAVFILLFSVILYRCVSKQETEIIPDTTSHPVTNNTLPGNYFTTSDGSFSLMRYDNSVISYQPQSGRCDYSDDAYVLSLKSTAPGVAFVNIYLKTIPSDSAKTLTLVPYGQQTLDTTNAFATITNIADGKTWRAVSGTLYVNVSKNVVSAYFDTVKVENASAITDTAVIRASAHLYCK